MLFMFVVMLALQPGLGVGGRAQRKQRQAEDTLKPYWGRISPEKLCKLLKCYSPVGSWCQVMKEGNILIPKCVCPQSCPSQMEPVCSVLGKTYRNECVLHKEACGKRRRIGLAHMGPCRVSTSVCTESELGQFPYRLMDWFLLLSRMGQSYRAAPPSQMCLSYSQRKSLAERRFILLDGNGDGKLSQRDLRKLHYKQMPLEQCARQFFQSCDTNGDKKVTLPEWIGCLVDRSQHWFQHFMSMKMGSKKLCPMLHDNI